MVPPSQGRIMLEQDQQVDQHLDTCNAKHPVGVVAPRLCFSVL